MEATEAGPRAPRPPARERIPFYRNIRVLGLLAQLLFLLLLAGAAVLIWQNVSSALARSRLPADFGFLTARAGIPIAESPLPYDPAADPYWKAILIGFLNTVRVAVVGVTLATLLGVLIGVMRLSGNWLVRQIATLYVEVVRNTPLAVQIVFWFTAILSPLPPRILNAVRLPGGALFSNKGLALPWLYPSHSFDLWRPWLLAAAAVLVVGLLLSRTVLRNRPGGGWLPPILVAAAVAGGGYLAAQGAAALPEGVTHDFNPTRGRGTVFIDANGNGRLDRGERPVPFAAVTVRIPEGTLAETSQNLTESGRAVPSAFRFPRVEPSEVEEARVAFADPAGHPGLGLHFTHFPSAGVVYQDRNGNGEYDPGEERDAEGRGFGGVRLVMTVTGFERRLVADRGGQVRVPAFAPPAAAPRAAAPAGGGGARFGVFGPVQPAEETGAAEGAAAELEVLRAGPLVISRPTVPVSNYEGGVQLSSSFLALLLALVIYTASYIAEIVRGGILAVPRGQTEAAKALGLSNRQTFTLIVFPQALRVILPPMISQYLNLTKNSSLAPLAAYAELFVISTIVANQTGASVPITLLLVVSYLTVSLAFAGALNAVNARLGRRGAR